MIKQLHLQLIVLSLVIVGCSQSPNTGQKPEQDKKESEQVEKYTEEEMKNIAFARPEIVKRCEKFFGTPEGFDYKVGDCIFYAKAILFGGDFGERACVFDGYKLDKRNKKHKLEYVYKWFGKVDSLYMKYNVGINAVETYGSLLDYSEIIRAQSVLEVDDPLTSAEMSVLNRIDNAFYGETKIITDISNILE